MGSFYLRRLSPFHERIASQPNLYLGLVRWAALVDGVPGKHGEFTMGHGKWRASISPTIIIYNQDEPSIHHLLATRQSGDASWASSLGLKHA